MDNAECLAQRSEIVHRLQQLGEELAQAETIGSILLTLGRIEQNKERLIQNFAVIKTSKICVTGERKD